jgi:hypothetical protein
MYRFEGYRPRFLLNEVHGKITNVERKGIVRTEYKDGYSSLPCVKIKLDNYSVYFVNENLDLGKLFHKEQEIRLLKYKFRGNHYFVEAVEGNRVLVEHTKAKTGLVVFILLIVSGFFLSFSFYVSLFVQKKKT